MKNELRISPSTEIHEKGGSALKCSISVPLTLLQKSTQNGRGLGYSNIQCIASKQKQRTFNVFQFDRLCGNQLNQFLIWPLMKMTSAFFLNEFA